MLYFVPLCDEAVNAESAARLTRQAGHSRRVASRRYRTRSRSRRTSNSMVSFYVIERAFSEGVGRRRVARSLYLANLQLVQNGALALLSPLDASADPAADTFGEIRRQSRKWNEIIISTYVIR